MLLPRWTLDFQFPFLSFPELPSLASQAPSWIFLHFSLVHYFPLNSSVQVEPLSLCSISKETISDKVSNDFPVPKSTSKYIPTRMSYQHPIWWPTPSLKQSSPVGFGNALLSWSSLSSGEWRTGHDFSPFAFSSLPLILFNPFVQLKHHLLFFRDGHIHLCHPHSSSKPLNSCDFLL